MQQLLRLQSLKMWGCSLEYLLRRPRGELRRVRAGCGLGVGSSQEGRLAPLRPSRMRRRQRSTQQASSAHSAAPASDAMIMPNTRPRWREAQLPSERLHTTLS